MALTPHEIVQELDQYVIGQSKAKRAIAIACRERLLRSQLGKSGKLITPNNILLIGNSGVGKTELARHLADILGCPFVKVEITEYTSSGYEGKNLESIFKNLLCDAEDVLAKQKSMRKKLSKGAIVASPGLLQYLSICFDHFDLGYLDKRLPVKQLIQQVYEKHKEIPYSAFVNKEDKWVWIRPDLQKQYGTFPNSPPSEVFEDVDISYYCNEGRKLIQYLGWLLGSAVGDGLKKEDLMIKVHPELALILKVYFSTHKDHNKLFDYFDPFYKTLLKKVGLKGILETIEFVGTYVTSDIERDIKEIIKRDEKFAGKKGCNFNSYELVNQFSIVFIDEIDKLFFPDSGSTNMNVGTTGIQRELLPYLDGCEVKIAGGTIDTSNILFITSGAFNMTKVTDIPPEMAGRLPIHVKMESLGEEDLFKILKKPKGSLLERYQLLFDAEGVKKFEITDDGLRVIANIGFELNKVKNTGARILKGLMSILMGDPLFEAHEYKDKELIIDEAWVKHSLKPYFDSLAAEKEDGEK